MLANASSGVQPTDAPSDPMNGYCVSLDDEVACDPAVAGGKAAALARVRRLGLPTLPGLVLTTEFSVQHDEGADLAQTIEHVYLRAGELADRLIVRSSSVVEDQSASSAAGQFESVADVTSDAEFRDAVETVLASRAAAGAPDSPIAVLIQPQIEPDVSGVLFGIDPVTGRADRRVVAAVRGRPDRLVGGDVAGSHHVIDMDGAVVESDVQDGVALDDRTLRLLTDVATELSRAFDGPQDVEWAMIGGELVVLQSRPVTTPDRGVPTGPRYGAHTLAETFPDPLAPLEVDLWVPPLDEAVRAALVLSGRHSRSAVSDRPLVIAVQGSVALDLELAGDGETPSTPGWIVSRRLRALRNAWRIGRLRAALPTLIDDLLTVVDADLASIPPPTELSRPRALALLRRARAALRSLHAHEMLAGAMTPAAGSASSSLTGASVALRVLAESRRDGMPDETILERHPIVLALTPPRIGPSPSLPGDAEASMSDVPLDDASDDASDDPDDGVRREALRLRIRWVHELTARVAWELGERMVRRGDLPDPTAVRHLTLAEVDAILAGRASAWTRALTAASAAPPAAPLPAVFRLSDRGWPIPITDAAADAAGSGTGTGAGGGVVVGTVVHPEREAGATADGAILVVRALSPVLAGRLATVAGIVSETGSPLSHLAILARERGVPVVVGCAGAVDRFPPGSRLRIDGSSGDVEQLHDTGHDTGHTETPA